MIRLGEEICTNLDAALRREWLETNGLGGFASGTVSGCNTRRYHGLLVAATKPPVGRFVLLSKLEETLIIDGRRYELGTNRSHCPGVFGRVLAKHSKSISLVDCVSVGVDRMQRNVEPMRDQVEPRQRSE